MPKVKNAAKILLKKKERREPKTEESRRVNKGRRKGKKHLKWKLAKQKTDTDPKMHIKINTLDTFWPP